MVATPEIKGVDLYGLCFSGIEYCSLGQMRQARRDYYVYLFHCGFNYTQAARMVGVSKRTGKAWRNGRTRSNGRNEKPLVDWYRKYMPIGHQIDSYFLSLDERIIIADHVHASSSIRHIARVLHRSRPRLVVKYIKIRTRMVNIILITRTS